MQKKSTLIKVKIFLMLLTTIFAPALLGFGQISFAQNLNDMCCPDEFDRRQAAADNSGEDIPHSPAKVKASPKGEVMILINVDKRKLYLYDNGVKIKEFPVAVGKQRTPTPIGEWKVTRRAENWGTGFGTRWMGLSVPWGLFGIHGTNKPGSIGSQASGGCIRMLNIHVEELYEWVKAGTTVKIVGQIYSPFYEERWSVHKGHRGSEVIEIQKGLAAEGYLKEKPDGIFGQATENALKKLQKDRGFEVTGQVDTDIWGVLGL